MTKDELARLREIANKATPGPWNRSMLYDVLRYNRKQYLLDPDDYEDKSHMPDEDDSGHIAAFCPSSALKLLDEIEAKDKLIEELMGALESIANQDSPLTWGDVMASDARKALAKAKELG